MDDARQWVSILAFVVSFAALIYTIIRNSKGDRDKQIEEVKERMNDVEEAFREDREASLKSRAEVREQIIQMKEQLRNMPDQATVHRIELGITRLQSTTEIQSQTLIAVSRRLEKALQSEGKMP